MLPLVWIMIELDVRAGFSLSCDFKPSTNVLKINLFHAEIQWDTCVCCVRRSAITLKPVSGEVNSIDYLVTVAACQGVGDIRQQPSSPFSKLII